MESRYMLNTSHSIIANKPKSKQESFSGLRMVIFASTPEDWRLGVLCDSIHVWTELVRLFWKICLIFIYLCGCLCVWMLVESRRGCQSPLRVTGRCEPPAAGAENLTRSSERAVLHTLNHAVISPTPWSLSWYHVQCFNFKTLTQKKLVTFHVNPINFTTFMA